MSGLFALAYASLSYVLFLATFAYAVGFVAGAPFLKTIDGGFSGDPWVAALVDVLLLGMFAVQHSVMARRGFKQWWARIVPQPVERATFVLATNLVLALLFWQWRPLPATVWSADSQLAQWLLIGLSLGGWAILLVSTYLINHFELFGLKQAYDHWRGRRVEEPVFRTPALYRFVRHPIYVGFIVAFWSTPHMTVGHLLFAVMTSGYIMVGIFFEERDLIAQFGDRYRRYRTEVGMLFPRLGGGTRQTEAARRKSLQDKATP